MKELFFFNSMLMPKVIVLIYWLLLAAAVLGGIGILFQGQFFYGIGVAVGGVIGARLYCELMIVLFKINDNLQKIADRNAQ